MRECECEGIIIHYSTLHTSKAGRENSVQEENGCGSDEDLIRELSESGNGISDLRSELGSAGLITSDAIYDRIRAHLFRCQVYASSGERQSQDDQPAVLVHGTFSLSLSLSLFFRGKTAIDH